MYIMFVLQILLLNIITCVKIVNWELIVKEEF